MLNGRKLTHLHAVWPLKQAREVVAFPRMSIHARPVAADDVAMIVSRKMQWGK